MKRNVDPVLEKLRREVDGPPNLDTLALNNQRLTANIHAAYLFEKEGTGTLRELCLLLSATATGKLYSGWQEFAAHLGLSLEQIQCIEYDFKGSQDPTYYVLLAYAQSVDATLDKIFLALQKIGRLDILKRIDRRTTEFIDRLDLKDDTDEIHKPRRVPRAPLVLTPAIPTDGQSETGCRDASGLDSGADASSSSRESSKKTGPCYQSTAMLTFTEDGTAVAKNIAKIFRAKEPRIGVLMLQEQEKYVYAGAEEFVEDCFEQVNYVVPILTRGYVQTINNSANGDSPLSNSLDSKYAKYVYSLLRYEYAKNNCRNNRARCILPESHVDVVSKSDLHPTLQAWFREADIDGFAENILLRKI